MSMNPNYIEDFNGSDYVCMTRSIPQSVSKLAAMTTVPSSAGVSQHYAPKMTIATSSTTSTGSPKHMQSNSVSSIDKPIVGTASAGMQLTSKNLQTLQQQEQLASNAAAQLQIGSGAASEKATSVSPTPSQLSSGSSKCTIDFAFACAKFLLKFINLFAEKLLPSKSLLPYNVTPPRSAGRSEAERKVEELTRQLEEEMERNEDQGEYFGICHTCGDKVTGAGQACQAMGNLYHTNCFICCSCGRALRGKAFYNVHGRVYCEEDYMVRFRSYSQN